MFLTLPNVELHFRCALVLLGGVPDAHPRFGLGIVKKREEYATGQEQARDNLATDRGSWPFGGAMVWRSSMSVTLLESAVTRNAPASPLECAVIKLLDLKSFRISSYKKCGGWGYQSGEWRAHQTLRWDHNPWLIRWGSR